LSTANGDASQRLLLLRRSKNAFLVAVVLGLLNWQLATGSSGSARVLWAVWVVLGYIFLRQRLYLNRQQQG